MGISSIGPTLVTTGVPNLGGVASPAVGSSLPNVASVPHAPTSTQAPSSAQISQAVKKVNDSFIQNNQNVYAMYEKDPTTGIEVVKFVDQDTKQTISQVPSKTILAIAQSIHQPQGSGGQLIDTMA
jgi:uncharacterized FlaG/YvyC family protein